MFVYVFLYGLLNKETAVLSCKMCPLSDWVCHLLPDHYWSPLSVDCNEETDGWDLQLLPPAHCNYLPNTPENWQDTSLTHRPKTLKYTQTIQQTKHIKKESIIHAHTFTIVNVLKDDIWWTGAGQRGSGSSVTLLSGVLSLTHRLKAARSFWKASIDV